VTGVQRFRRRPGMVDAIQWHGEPNCAEVFAFLGLDHQDWADDADHSELHVRTLEGPVTATPGYWVVRGPDGNFWPVRPDQFAATYELAAEVSR
jgi:hypothetical protein